MKFFARQFDFVVKSKSFLSIGATTWQELLARKDIKTKTAAALAKGSGAEEGIDSVAVALLRALLIWLQVWRVLKRCIATSDSLTPLCVV